MRLSADSVSVAGARQFHRHAQARQRRTQLVRNIEQQAALGGQQRLDAAGHAVEGARELAQLVAAGGIDARGESPCAEALHGLLQLAHRASQVKASQ